MIAVRNNLNENTDDSIITTEDINCTSVREELMTAWADADCEGDQKLAKRHLERFIRFMSSLTLLYKLAPSMQELEEIEGAMEEFKSAKEELRRINQQTILAA